ncbi:hypothetical protein ABKN59_011431 [Abortiporus biennis]
MYASLSSDCAAIVSETLFATIPSTAEDFASSLSSTVLGQLSKSFWFVEYLGSRTLREHHLAVDFSLAALQTLTNMSFKETGTIKDADDSNDGHGKHKTQRHLKNARKYQKPVIDATVFEKLKVAVPGSQQEADNLVATIIADQRDILKYYLFSLRLSEHAAIFQQLLAGEPDTEEDGRNETAPNGGFDDLHNTITDDTPSAYPFVQPKKAALYFETAEGFGDWRILISTRAYRALRETRKKDPNLFKIIVKKIKELSNGHFSDDNQKRLTGSSGNNIPIYEAKMTSDTRLVYHIDCLKDYDSEVEWQGQSVRMTWGHFGTDREHPYSAIRIFGLYTHAKLDERLWSAVSNQLSGQGKEYRRRCIFRKPPLGGGRVYQPASFPSLEVDSPTSPTAVRIPNLRTEDRDELHGLLVLEKFVTFSQALLNSILADQNVAHVFQMSARLLIRNINDAGIQGRKLDFIYVDEAQDNLIIDAFVLRSMCRNPNGLFWAGDTAQTISAGSAFRFTDLKASMYKYDSELVQNDSGVKSPMQELPRTFELTVNYRSHGGIMGCANSVIKLITQFWPDAIDNMAEEKGVVDGVKPLFFHGWGQDTVRYEQFLFGASGDHIEFGHHQCILVRDAAARDKLKSEVGEIGIIMTIYDSKGLEFDDVLLYNFFEDSPVQLARWRVVLNVIASDEGGCPRFDKIRHASVCRELKFLYVAITRARKNLWIADASTKGEPMRSIWNHTGLIHNCTPGGKIPHLAVSSTQEEWAETGRHLFTLERYPQAAHCYQRAGMVREKDIALAYHTRYELQARSWRRGMDHERISAFVAIAEEFLRLAAISPLEEFTYYRIAGECFAEVGEDRRAAEAYLRAKEYSSSAKSYRNAECFDEAVEIVQSHTTSIASTDAQSIINAAKIVWFKLPKSYEKAIALFPGVDCALKFTEDYEFDDARLDILVKQTEYPGIEAADLYFFKHEYHRAIRIYLDNHCTSKAQECLLTVFWRYASFGSRIDEAELIPLIQLSREVAKHPEVSNHVKDQLRMFEAIISQDFHQLEDLGVGFYEHDTVTISNTLLCLDYAYKTFQKFKLAQPYKLPLFFVDRSFLYAPAMADPYITKPKLEQEVACPEISVRICDLPRILGPALRKRLSSRVQKLHDPFWLSAFQPYVLDVNFYHSRLQMHFQHILTCRGVFIGRREKASFITMLYHALKPSMTHAFSLNVNSARVFIPKALSHHRDRPSELHRSSGKRYILDDLFVFLDGNDVDSITAGTLFLRHVIDGRFSVDIGVLCDLIDMVYGSVMIIDRLQRYQNLHNLALPRTWLLAIAGDNRLKTKKLEWTTQKPLLLSVKSLLDDVYNYADHLYLVNRSLYKYDFQVANILVGRLCRTISLFGYNVVSYRDLIQRDVISALTSLVQEGRTFHSLYTAFIQAGEWRDVTYAIKKQQVYYGCNRDPLIQLKQQSRVLEPVFTPWGMHTVIYEQVEDIVPLIRRNERDGDVHTRVNGQVSDTGTFLDDNAAQGDSKDDTQESNGCEDELEYSAHNPDAVEMISGHYLSLMTVSEEYLAAVSAMQRQYRRLISRRREKEIRQSDPFNMLFSACVEASHSFGIRYKTEFRNVLPHALSCLNKMYLGMEKLKKDALKRMKKAHTRELDEATDLVDEVKLRFNEVKSIQKLLSPLSDFHKKQDLVTFKNNVLSIERLSTQLQLIPVKFNPSTSLPQTEMNEWKKDLEEALQRLKIARIPQKNLKPRLNVDDLDPHC